MLIVPVEKLREGMQLADDVGSTTANDYQIILKKGIYLSSGMIEMLLEKGIKTVHIVGGGIEYVGNKKETQEEIALVQKRERRNVQVNAKIGEALKNLDDIFEENTEIKALSQEAVKKVDSIADDIIIDIASDSSFLGNQMIALQNYDDYTYKHCLRVAMLSASVCAQLELSIDETKETVIAGLLHDIGKCNIDHDIIVKPEKLTDEEYMQIKKHPLIGYNILKQSNNYSSNILSGVLFHQEKYDGSGYPTGISGDKIPLVARILAVCDVFDALTSNRPYRVPWSVAETEEYILGSCGTHFDMKVTRAFMRAFNPYPVGTMVSLSDGRYGVVVAHNENVLRPVVKIRGEFSGEELDLMNDFRFLSITVTGVYDGEY